MALKKPYRKQRKQEIQFKKAFLRFSVAFFLVLGFGVFSRVVIQSFPLQEKLSETLKDPEGYTLEMKGAHFQFHSGWLPVIAIHVPRISLADKKCVSNTLRGQNLLLIFDMLKMLQGKFEPGRVLLDFVEGNHYQTCQLDTQPSSKKAKEKATTNASNDNRTVSPRKKEKAFQINKEHFQTFFENVWPELKKLSIENLSISEVNWNEYLKVNEKLHLSGHLRIKKNEKLRLDFELDRLTLKGEKMESLFAKGEVLISEDGAILDLKNKVREGEMVLSAEIARKPDWPLDLRFKIKRLPISAFSTLINESLKISYLWATCEGSLKAPLAKLLSENMQMGKCEITGPYGDVRIKKLIANLEGWKEFEVEINKLELDETLKEKRDLYFSGVLAEYGTVSAQISFKNDLYDIRGHVENSQFLFSKSNLRDVQKVLKIPFEVQGNFENWKALIKEVVLEDGEFIGDIQLESSGNTKNARGRIAVHRLLLSPRIYKLILRSDPAELRVYGKFLLEEGQIQEWSALLATPELKSESYVLKNLKVKGEMVGKDVSQVNINVAEGFLKKESPFMEWVKPTYLDAKWQNETLEFQELSTKLELYPDQKVEWSRGYVRLKNGWQLSSEGAHYPNRQVIAWLQWDRPKDRKFLKWDFKGPFFAGQWYPKSPWVREWLNDHPQFLKENKSVNLQPFTEESTLPKSSLKQNVPELDSSKGV